MTARRDIPEADFPDHVRQMHEDRDHKFELEYKVSGAPHTGRGDTLCDGLCVVCSL